MKLKHALIHFNMKKNCEAYCPFLITLAWIHSFPITNASHPYRQTTSYFYVAWHQLSFPFSKNSLTILHKIIYHRKGTVPMINTSLGWTWNSSWHRPLHAYHGGDWHLTEHIPALSAPCCGTMHTMLACALFHTMKLSALNFQPNIIYPYIDIRHTSWCPHKPSL